VSVSLAQSLHRKLRQAGQFRAKGSSISDCTPAMRTTRQP
jgi:hypothetical protein